MVAIKQDYPGDARRRRHLEFISVNWNQLARESYAMFLKHGPGVLVVNEADFIKLPRAVVVRFGMAYVSGSTPGFHEVLGEQERGWIKKYDPDTTMLIGFVREDDGFSSYRMSPVELGRTPKALFECRK